jgi:hypothetical protein
MDFSFAFNILFVVVFALSLSLLVPNKIFLQLVVLTFLSALSYIVAKVVFCSFSFLVIALQALNFLKTTLLLKLKWKLW